MAATVPDPSQVRAYEYGPLPSATSIRLLRRVTYRRRDGNTDSNCLAFELHTFDLDGEEGPPAFEALSYTWGDPYPPGAPVKQTGYDVARHWALVDGATLHLTANLHEALLELTREKFLNYQPVGGVLLPLAAAAKKGDLREVRALIRAGARVAGDQYAHDRPLEYAYRGGHLEVVKELTKPEYQGQYLHNRFYNRPDTLSHKMEEYVKGLLGAAPDFDGYWWVDAICINQNDVEERAAQVQLMSRIYSTARRVPVWLGKPYGRQKDSYNYGFGYLLDHQSAPYTKPRDISRDIMRETAELFKRNWFTRTWIIQEIVLARFVEFKIGREGYPYEKVDGTLKKISTMDYLPGRDPSEIREGNRAIQQGESLRLLRNRYQGEHRGEISLYAVLAQSSSYECTEPRDRIYSVLNLLRNQDGEPEIPMEIDYTAPLHEVFTIATRQALMEAQSLSLLSWASAWFDGDAVASELPSWVPAYHLFRAIRGPESSLEGLPQVLGVDLLSSPARRACFSASGRLRRDKNEQAFEGIVTPFSPELEINGLSIDRIAEVEEAGSDPQKIRFRPRWLSLITKLGPKYVNGDSLAKALMLTVFTNKYNSGSAFKPTTSSSAWDNAKKVWRDLICNSLAVDKAKVAGRTMLSAERIKTLDDLAEADGEGFMVGSKDLAAYDPDAKDLSDQFRGLLVDDNAHQVLAECLFNALNRRVMFITEKGYLGLGPVGTRAGDEVWILPAASVPFILRQKDDDSDQYRHIGETYVHGVMYGEAVPDPKVKLKSILLV